MVKQSRAARVAWWVLDRAREPSSWAGVAVLLGLVVPPEVAGGVASVGAGVAGLLAVALREG